MKLSTDIGSLFLNFDNARLVTFVNPYSYFIFKDSGLYADFSHIYVDGISLVWLHNLICTKKIERRSFDFTSMAPLVFEYCEREKLSVALVGASPEENQIATRLLKKKYPLLNVAYSIDGYFSDSSELIKNINEKKIDIVIVGMGTPLQEKVLVELKEKCFGLKLGFTCGGFISQLATKEDYFNPILSRLNLRWLQRFIRHGYVRKRVLIDYPVFFIKFLFLRCFSKK